MRRRFFYLDLNSRTTSIAAALIFLSGLSGEAAETSANGKSWEEFSGDKALAHVQQLVDFGPRPAGSEAIEKSRTYIDNQLRLAGWQVARQAFSGDTPRGKVSFVNLIARFGKPIPKVEPGSLFLLCSHYDTKIFRAFPFVGANDGGSSNGVLLEMARVLGKHSELGAKVELVFFDGEEAVESFSETDGIYGSRYFAKQLSATKESKQFRGGILFDMIGDRSLKVTLPPDSPTKLAREVFSSAEALKSEIILPTSIATSQTIIRRSTPSEFRLSILSIFDSVIGTQPTTRSTKSAPIVCRKSGWSRRIFCPSSLSNEIAFLDDDGARLHRRRVGERACGLVCGLSRYSWPISGGTAISSRWCINAGFMRAISKMELRKSS